MSAKPEIVGALGDLQDPAAIATAVMKQDRIILHNVRDELQSARTLSAQLHARAIASDATGHLGNLDAMSSRLREVMQHAGDLLDDSEGRIPESELGEALREARKHTTAAEEILARGLDAVLKTTGLEATFRSLQSLFRADPDQQTESRSNREEILVDLSGQLIELHTTLQQIDRLRHLGLSDQLPQAREHTEFRTLEDQWHACREDLVRALELAVHSAFLTELNSAVETHFGASMQVSSLDRFRDTLTKEKIVRTSAFDDLDILIRQRHGGSFGISGPRGVGKSTLIDFFTTAEAKLDGESSEAPEKPRLGIQVSAPVKYDRREFILHIHAELCRAVLGDLAEADIQIANARSWNSRTTIRQLTMLTSTFLGGLLILTGAAFLAHYVRNFQAPAGTMGYASISMLACSATLLALFLLNCLEFAGIILHGRTLGNFGINHAERESVRMRVRSARRTSISIFLCWLFIATGVGGIWLLSRVTLEWSDMWPLLAGLLASALGIPTVVTKGFRYRAGLDSHSFAIARRFPGRYSMKLTDDATGQLRRIQYQQGFTTERSMGGKVGGTVKLPVAIEMARKEGVNLTERAMTYPEIVADLKRFLLTLAQEVEPVVAIDELDKMHDIDAVQEFLNEVKGIFGVAGCIFLVSVSEDAAASFERRGMPFRDVFDSSFDEIVTLERMGVDQARKILYGLLLGWTEPFVGLCYVLSGGLPRDLHRSTRLLIGGLHESSKIDLSAAVPDVFHRECSARLRAVRHALMADPLDITGIALLKELGRIEPSGRATAALLTQWRDILQHWVTEHGQPETTSERLPRAVRLGQELEAFMYFAMTVFEFFEPDRIASRMKDAKQSASGAKSLSMLAYARHTISLDPGASMFCTKAFREAWGFESRVPSDG
ncbi:hypothetical protein [Streptomyces phaeochromogenes]|uniref:hypothetical protein n=1 Tax=Streptomyces phaeochromogenes TaxID=1923 RepID=UPI0006E40D4C|nr:hypothetical protein [Streptomyces phaeochromogenes]